MRISREKSLELHTENPEFGLYPTKMMVDCPSADANRDALLHAA